MVLQLLSFVAENERANIRQRQAEGIMSAKARGVRFGRPKVSVSEDFSDNICSWENGELPLNQAET